MPFDYEFLKQPYQREAWKSFLRHVFPNESDLFAAPQTFPELKGERIRSFVQFGNIHLQDRFGSQLALFEVMLEPDTTKLQINRVALRAIIEKLRRDTLVTGAFAVFADDSTGKWRFTFIAKQEIFGEKTIETADPRRFTYVFGPGETTRTAEQRFTFLAGKSGKQLEDVLEAFSVEKISNEFFKKYKAHYETLCRHLYQKPEATQIFQADTPAAAQKLMRDFAKKLMGRLVFLYFLQKKGWLGAAVGVRDWKNGDPNFVQNLFKNTAEKSRFHSRELTRLFFETLNERRAGDLFKMPDGTTVRVPYLNGGLFDDDLPAASSLDFPETWFAEVFEFFSQYNFTIDENAPNDQEVGIDPEMLGHIFENLLEENREKGAIYTPKEIVHFMCQQSLAEWLARRFLGKIDELAIRHFVKTKEVGGIPKPVLIEILHQLDNIQVCDPAIGSGAFPMGLLQEIYMLKEAIYLETKGLKAIVPAKLKAEIIQKSIFGVDIDSGAVDIARLRFWLAVIVDENEPQELPNLDYKIMQGNSLLESFEDVDLSRLTDMANDGNDDDIIFAEKTQLVLGADFSKSRQSMVLFDKVEKEELYQKIDNFFAEREPDKKESRKAEINKILDGRIHYLLLQNAREKERHLKSLEDKFSTALGKDFEEKLAHTKNKDFKTYQKLKAELQEIREKEARLLKIQHGEDRPFFLWKVYFHRVFQDGGFDIVIANPPYMRVQEIEKSFPAEKKAYEETLADGKPRFEVAKAAYDIANLFFEMTIKKLAKPDGVNCFIFPHKFFNAGSGEAFRDFLMQGRFIDRIAHFGANRVFNDVDTYVCVALFSAKSNEGFWLQKFPFRSEFRELMLDDSRYQFIEYLKLENAARLHGSNQWIFFNSAAEYEAFEKMYWQTKPFAKVFEDIFQGIATSHDKLYFLEVSSETEAHYFGRNQVSEKEWQVEKAFFKPILKGRDVHRFATLKTKTYVFFPYEFDIDEKGKNVAKPVSLSFLEEICPFTHAFVVEQEAEFKARERGKAAKMPFWYEYIYPKNLVKFEQEKLSSMEICTTHPNVTMNDGDLYHNTTIYSWVKSHETSESYEFLLAIANSSLLWWFLQNTGDTLQGDARRLKTNYLNPFPIPKKVADADEKAVAQLVRHLLWLGRGEPTGLSISNEAVAQNFRQVLDACVCELYFSEEMAAQSVDVLRFVREDLGEETVAAVFKKWQLPDSEVRNRLKLMTIRLPELLKPILESTQPHQK